MFEDYYYDNPQLQGLLAAAAGGPIMDAPRQAAVMPMTQQAVAPLSYEALADRRAAANAPPPGTSIVGPTAGEDPLAFGTGNTFSVGQGQEVRLVDAGGNVIVSGSGVEGANRAVAAAQSLSDELGKNANFKIQTGERTINPDGTVGETRYVDVARAAPSQSGLGFLADNVLPFAASFIPGIGPIAGAALGSALSSGLQGRSLQDALTRAAIAGGSAYAGGQLFGPATSGATPTPGGNIASVATPAIPSGAFDGILVNATRAVAPSLVGSAIGSAVGSSLPSLINSPSGTQQDIVVTGREKPALNLGPDFNIGGMLNTLPSLVNASPPTSGDIVVTGTRPQEPNLSNTLGAVSSLINPQPSMPGDIVVTGTRPQEQNIGGVLGQVLGGTLGGTVNPLPPTFSATTPPSTKDGVLGTGLTLAQLISIGGVGADLLGSLLGGSGGGGGAGTPYVSPFGTGVGFARGQDMRANPNILDYERYGFGPEAMFFRPEYSGLVSGAAPTQAPQAMTINPAYMPLI